MKNVHTLPTEKPSRLVKLKMFGKDKLHLCKVVLPIENEEQYQHIYITSDEQIKEGDWVIAIEGIWKNTITKITGTPITDVWMKIILTTDPDLLGVQSIDNEFLEWFVKNPSCEEVEVKKGKLKFNDDGEEYGFPDMSLYKIIIPKEEPKQETLEEAAESYCEKVWGGYKDDVFKHDDIITDKTLSEISKKDFTEGAKWQQERMYSKADKIMKFLDTEVELKLSDKKTIERIKWYFETYFEQFKKK